MNEEKEDKQDMYYCCQCDSACWHDEHNEFMRCGIPDHMKKGFIKDVPFDICPHCQDLNKKYKERTKELVKLFTHYKQDEFISSISAWSLLVYKKDFLTSFKEVLKKRMEERVTNLDPGVYRDEADK